MSDSPAAVLWTGGKDSAVALAEAAERFAELRLVTFVPAGEPDFKAHPLALIEAQAAALPWPHERRVVREPFEQGYERAIAELRDDGVRTLITGDIAEVDGHSNWIEERARGLCDVWRPLWGAERVPHLRRLVRDGYEVFVSLAERSYRDGALAGQRLDAGLLAQLEADHAAGLVDACGENGEYHTWVLDGPHFTRRLLPRCAEPAVTAEHRFVTLRSVSFADSTRATR
ncbi:MAG: hypothetical protein DHS20C15_32940 [Planctomycetota bacterium]|nr:MAG: hypothetical protein DHS20C15_32940 [Planctomycetota bacterium]